MSEFMKHYVNEEDHWYSCPKSGQCANEDEDPNVCTCDADRVNSEIGRLKAEVEKLKRIIQIHKPMERYQELEDEVEQYQKATHHFMAKNDRYREALEAIRFNGSDTCDHCRHHQKIVREALQ